jgi:hypothetical protein
LVTSAGAIAHRLDGHHRVLVFAEKHLAKLACANGLDRLKVGAMELEAEQRTLHGYPEPRKDERQ